MSPGIALLTRRARFGKSTNTHLNLALAGSSEHLRFWIEWILRLQNLFKSLSSRNSDKELDDIITNKELLFYLIIYFFF